MDPSPRLALELAFVGPRLKLDLELEESTSPSLRAKGPRVKLALELLSVGPSLKLALELLPMEPQLKLALEFLLLSMGPRDLELEESMDPSPKLALG